MWFHGLEIFCRILDHMAAKLVYKGSFFIGFFPGVYYDDLRSLMATSGTMLVS